MVKILPSSAGGVGSIPGQGDSTCLLGKKPKHKTETILLKKKFNKQNPQKPRLIEVVKGLGLYPFLPTSLGDSNMTQVWEPLQYSILPLKVLSEMPKNSQEAQAGLELALRPPDD